jgi:hypothetical protein
MVLEHHGVKMKMVTTKREKVRQVDKETDHRDSVNILSTQMTTNLKWDQTLNFKDIEFFYNNFQGPSHNLPVGSVEKTASFRLQIELSVRW